MKPEEILKLYPFAKEIRKAPNGDAILMLSNGWIRLRNIEVIWED